MLRGESIAVKVLEFRPYRKNSQRGFVTVEMPSGMIFHDLLTFTGEDGNSWVNPPSKPAIGRDGKPIIKAGKPLYNPIVSFDNKDTQTAWSDRIIESLLEAYPNALDCEERKQAS